MAKPLQEWVATDVERVSGNSMRWLAGEYFFRDPLRPLFIDASYFFAPADGVILYQRQVGPDEPLVEIKGRPYTLREAMRDGRYNRTCLVIGIFMTVYDVHVNRIPYSGMLVHRMLPPLDTYNRPMLAVESALLHGHLQAAGEATYLFSNQRMLNRIYASSLGLEYYVLQIADYDVEAIAMFDLRQHQHLAQNERFAQVRFGSQVDLIIPVSPRWRLETLVPETTHVEAGVDALVRIVLQESPSS